MLSSSKLSQSGFTDYEISNMADVLMRKFGAHAIHVAADIAIEHWALDDFSRAQAWDRVRMKLTRARTLS